MRNAIRDALASAGAQDGSDADAAKPGVVREATGVYGKASSESLEERAERIFALVKNQDEY